MRHNKRVTFSSISNFLSYLNVNKQTIFFQTPKLLPQLRPRINDTSSLHLYSSVRKAIFFLLFFLFFVVSLFFLLFIFFYFPHFPSVFHMIIYFFTTLSFFLLFLFFVLTPAYWIFIHASNHLKLYIRSSKIEITFFKFGKLQWLMRIKKKTKEMFIKCIFKFVTMTIEWIIPKQRNWIKNVAIVSFRCLFFFKWHFYSFRKFLKIYI